MKSISLIAAALLAMSPLNTVIGNPLTGHDPVKVIFNSGDKNFTLVEGSNTLSKATTFQCASSEGCVVSASATAQLNGGSAAVYLCTYIDGKQAKPVCGKVTDDNSIMSLRQYATVTQGVHIIQTMLYSYDTCCGPVVKAWETEYTIYAGK